MSVAEAVMVLLDPVTQCAKALPPDIAVKLVPFIDAGDRLVCSPADFWIW